MNEKIDQYDYYKKYEFEIKYDKILIKQNGFVKYTFDQDVTLGYINHLLEMLNEAYRVGFNSGQAYTMDIIKNKG